jgi:hypothetical protein
LYNEYKQEQEQEQEQEQDKEKTKNKWSDKEWNSITQAVHTS